MAPESIILIVDDATILPVLENALRAHGYPPLVATDEAALTGAIGTAPVLVIVDLTGQSFDGEALVMFLKGVGKKADHVPILGFGSKVGPDLRRRATAAGCNAVVEREELLRQLPQLIDHHKWAVDQEVRCQDLPPPLLVQGIKLLNDGEFFECHEVIEDAWNEEKSPVRVMYQGILQIGVACYHIQNRNWRGSMKLLQRGIPKIERFGPTCMGLDLVKLITDAEVLRDMLVRLGPDWEGEIDTGLFPVIKLPDQA